MMVFYGQTVDGIPDRGYILYITALVMVLVAAVFVAARLGTRIVTRQLGLDDICLGLALVSSIVLTAAIDMCELRILNYVWYPKLIIFKLYTMAMADTSLI
jgi:hypothetical protein